MREEINNLAPMLIGEISKKHIAEWRDRKLAIPRFSGASLNREWAILNNAFNVAVNEWEWLEINPMSGVSKPEGNPPRERLITDEEINTMLHVLSYTEQGVLDTVTKRVGAILLFALETAMRAQEVCLLRWDEIDGRVVQVNTSKTRSGIRQVPLSSRAAAIIDQLRPTTGDCETVFEVSATQLDALFRKARKNAMLEGFTFHDSRATAITRLAKKLDILELAKMIGHKNLSILMVYYRESAEELVKKLD